MIAHDEKPRILMVDDDPDFQSIVRGWTAPQYDHIGLGSGEGLIETMSNVEPDIVIMDVRMPGPDGFFLCKSIRSDPRFSDIPIIFLTGCAEDENFIRHLDVAGTAYLTKPVARKRLLSTLRENLTDSIREQ
ncbi:MAG TPA: response regulator [Elusimicrobiota bacterium]|nr:response regulator [Elusimicrobiota bacterium]